MVFRFDKVDAVDARSCIRFLDYASAISEVAAFKKRSIDLLELGAGQVAVDIGCGTGDEACAMARRVGPHGRAIGIDASAKMVAEATRRVRGAGLPVTFQVGDVYALNFDDAALDACRADRLFHFLQFPLRAMLEIARVTKRGGHISVGEPVWDALIVSGGEPALTEAILATRRGKQQGIGRALPALFEAAGVQVQHVLPADLMVTDVATARYLFGLVEMANSAEASGAVAPGDADRWLDSLVTAEAAGRLRCVLPGFTVAGVR